MNSEIFFCSLADYFDWRRDATETDDEEEREEGILIRIVDLPVNKRTYLGFILTLSFIKKYQLIYKELGIFRCNKFPNLNSSCSSFLPRSSIDRQPPDN